jgi:hypothetical protein
VDFQRLALQLANELNLQKEQDINNLPIIECALSGCYIEGLNDGRNGDPQANREEK